MNPLDPETYHKDDYTEVTYYPIKDYYILRIKSTKGFERIINLDKKLLEGFSRDINNLLLRKDLSFGLSRLDLERTHDAVFKTMEKYNQEFEEFKKREIEVFIDKRNPADKARLNGFKPGQSPDDLKKIIGELTVQNEILKKAQELLG